MKITYRLKQLIGLTLIIALEGCASSPATSTPTPALGPIRLGPTAQPAGPLPTITTEGETLPGRLLFVQGGNLWLWQGSAGRQISSSGDSFQPAWSPDGQQIAYIQRGASYSDLLVIAADSSAAREPLRLTQDGPDSSVYSYERIYSSMWAFYPAWSPDGATIAFAAQAGPPSGSPAAEFHMSLFSIPAGAAGGRTQLYADEEGQVGRLAYAPDGETIIFAYGPSGAGAPALYRYTHESGNATPLAGAPAQSYDPALSPDGRWLAFAARDASTSSDGISGRTDVFAMRLGDPSAGSGGTSGQAGAPIRLTSLGAARAPAFSPDGKLLAFLAIAPGANSFDLWVVELRVGADGALEPGQPRQVTQGMALDADSGVAWGR